MCLGQCYISHIVYYVFWEHKLRSSLQCFSWTWYLFGAWYFFLVCSKFLQPSSTAKRLSLRAYITCFLQTVYVLLSPTFIKCVWIDYFHTIAGCLSTLALLCGFYVEGGGSMIWRLFTYYLLIRGPLLWYHFLHCLSTLFFLLRNRDTNIDWY